MDLYQIIGELVAERARLTQIIGSLESMQEGSGKASRAGSKKPRGRKSMDSAARKEVSERMKKYWAKRRQESGGS